MSTDPTARTGRCLCGAVTYEITGDPMATAICHCEHCQRQSGGAFSVNVVVHTSQLDVSGMLQTYEETDEDGTVVYVRRRFCSKRLTVAPGKQALLRRCTSSQGGGTVLRWR